MVLYDTIKTEFSVFSKPLFDYSRTPSLSGYLP